MVRNLERRGGDGGVEGCLIVTDLQVICRYMETGNIQQYLIICNNWPLLIINSHELLNGRKWVIKCCEPIQ